MAQHLEASQHCWAHQNQEPGPTSLELTDFHIQDCGPFKIKVSRAPNELVQLVAGTTENSRESTWVCAEPLLSPVELHLSPFNLLVMERMETIVTVPLYFSLQTRACFYWRLILSCVQYQKVRYQKIRYQKVRYQKTCGCGSLRCRQGAPERRHHRPPGSSSISARDLLYCSSLSNFCRDLFLLFYLFFFFFLSFKARYCRRKAGVCAR